MLLPSTCSYCKKKAVRKPMLLDNPNYMQNRKANLFWFANIDVVEIINSLRSIRRLKWMGRTVFLLSRSRVVKARAMFPCHSSTSEARCLLDHYGNKHFVADATDPVKTFHKLTCAVSKARKNRYTRGHEKGQSEEIQFYTRDAAVWPATVESR